MLIELQNKNIDNQYINNYMKQYFLTALKYALGFAILFWLSSICGVIFLPVEILSENNILLGILHCVLSTLWAFFFSWLIFKKVGKHCIEFTFITFLSLLEYHCFSNFKVFETVRGGMMPFVVVFFFMAILVISFFFTFTYLAHKALFKFIRLGYKKCFE